MGDRTPFELHLDGLTVTGRADVILDREGGVPTGLAILDYKTSTSADNDHGLQLQVYADAGRREGLDVRGAYVHDLKAGARKTVDVSDDALHRQRRPCMRPLIGSVLGTTRDRPGASAAAARYARCVGLRFDDRAPD